MMVSNSRSAIRFLLKCFTVLIGIVAFGTTLRWAESEFYPVVPVFKVKEQSWNGTVLTVWGFMDKQRPCKFDDLLAYYVTENGLSARAAVDYPRKKSRPPIKQAFGPIWITMPKDYVPGTKITFWANHECHPLWMSMSKIGSFTPSLTSEEKPVL